MKNLLIACAVALIGLSSCSKDDNQPNDLPSIYKVDIAHDGALDMYNENLQITVITENGQQIKLLGETWNDGEIMNAGEGVYNYSKSGKPTSRTLETDSKVKAVMVTEIVTPLVDDAKEPLNTVVTIYKDGIVKAKKTHTFRDKDNNILTVY